MSANGLLSLRAGPLDVGLFLLCGPGEDLSEAGLMRGVTLIVTIAMGYESIR